MVQICPECNSVHFNVRWSNVPYIWLIVCEGCGTVYELAPTGMMVLRMRGVQES